MLLSVVIAARDASSTLGTLLASLAASERPVDEVIVVDDGSRSSIEPLARRYGAQYIRNEVALGPAVARNRGVAASKGGIILFFDADVSVHPDTVGRLAGRLEADDRVDGVIGSYDDQPSHQGFLSRYRNLLHAWVHQNAARDASTFWGACGAIRREVFLAAGGFSEAYARPSIEDIELGCRLIKEGRKLVLDRQARICHHKSWSFLQMVRTDILDRAVPWTRLILSERHMPNDLNLRRSQRLNAVLALLSLVMAPTAFLSWNHLAGWLAVSGAYLARNRRFYAYLASNQGIGFALRAIPVHWLYFIYSCAGFAIGLAWHMLPGQGRQRVKTGGQRAGG
ncbi:MAG: glycosyl transferase [Candidatus Solibacter sp.]|nr:glycosyl transferase [Candidatus Solibacter sp.]